MKIDKALIEQMFNDRANCYADSDTDSDEQAMTFDAVWELINALPASEDEWVSVSERLPEDEKVVLVWLPLDDMPDIGGRKLAYIADGRWYGGIKQILGVTHWQPLPSPPTK